MICNNLQPDVGASGARPKNGQVATCPYILNRIITDGCLIAAAENYPKLMAFDVMGNNNGCFRWTYDFESSVTGGPIMDNNGVIYVGTMGKLYALVPEE